MNIVCDGKTLKHVKQETGHAYSLDELVFFIDKKFAGYKFYMIISDGNKYDAVELKQTNSTSKDYYNYVCAMNATVKITSGECSYSLLGIAHDEVQPSVCSDCAKIMFDNTAYNFKAQINVIEQFSKHSAETYKAMLCVYNNMIELSKMNIEMIGGGE